MMAVARSRAQQWWHRWSAVVMICAGALLIFTAIVTGALALKVKSDSRATARQALVSCQRAREFGPPLGAFFTKHHVLPRRAVIDGKVHDVQADYTATIPKACK